MPTPKIVLTKDRMVMHFADGTHSINSAKAQYTGEEIAALMSELREDEDASRTEQGD